MKKHLVVALAYDRLCTFGFGAVERLIRERVAIVKDLLETSALPLARVAERAGFGSEQSLRHHFRRLAATTPGAYRRRFSDTIAA